jgi:hypothetical protein
VSGTLVAPTIGNGGTTTVNGTTNINGALTIGGLTPITSLTASNGTVNVNNIGGAYHIYPTSIYTNRYDVFGGGGTINLTYAGCYAITNDSQGAGGPSCFAVFNIQTANFGRFHVYFANNTNQTLADFTFKYGNDIIHHIGGISIGINFTFDVVPDIYGNQAYTNFIQNTPQN